MRPAPNLRLLSPDGDGVLWCCECGDQSCRRHFHVPAEEATTLRDRFPLGYVVSPGHVRAPEKVVHFDGANRFVVVLVAAAAACGDAIAAGTGFLP